MWRWKGSENMSDQKPKTKHRVNLNCLPVCLIFLADLHARQQPEQPPPADPSWDLAVRAWRDDAAVRYGHVGANIAGPRLRRGDRLLPGVLHPVSTRPGERPGEKPVPKNHEEVIYWHFYFYVFKKKSCKAPQHMFVEGNDSSPKICLISGNMSF